MEILLMGENDEDACLKPLLAAQIKMHLEIIDSGKFYENLPIINLNENKTSVSIVLIAPKNSNNTKFFLEMISNWLLPGEKLDPTYFISIDFKVEFENSPNLSFTKIRLDFQDHGVIFNIKKGFKILERELKIGMCKPYFAKKILEVKGLSSQSKTAYVQEHIAYLVKRLPEQISREIFIEMQHILVLCSEKFKSERGARLLTRLITLNYLFKKWLFESCKIAPNRRHIKIKIFKSQIYKEEKEKKVVSLAIGINLLDENEIFEEKHIQKGIQSILPDVVIEKGSFFHSKKDSSNIRIMYLEISKLNGEILSPKEIHLLNSELAIDLKARVERLMQPIFMPKNEEEIMRNALSLANQIQYLSDPSQVFISFQEQTLTHIYFTVILVYLKSKSSLTTNHNLEQTTSKLQIYTEWTKPVGSIRKKYVKEAATMRVGVSKDAFLREDHSLDLYKARQVVFEELQRIFGPLRDYNGGLISKEGEQLSKLKQLLYSINIHQDFLVENFFYSLTPSSMRNILEPEVLRALFLMVIDTADLVQKCCEEPYAVKILRELDIIYVSIASDISEVHETIVNQIDRLKINPQNIAHVKINPYNIPCQGYIYRCDDPYNQEHFCQTIMFSLEKFIKAESSIKWGEEEHFSAALN
ncbi:MAG: hypothetical protein Tsb0021_05360 [Chlamydiales bacterium]